MDFDSVMTKLNPLIVGLLESRLHGVASKGLMVLHITGRRSGVRYKIPVGYQCVGTEIQILISKASRKQWWRNFSDPASLQVTLRGKQLGAQCQVMDKNSEAFESLVLQTLNNLPALIKQFDLTMTAQQLKEQGLSDEQWQQVKSNAEAVSMNLTG